MHGGDSILEGRRRRRLVVGPAVAPLNSHPRDSLLLTLTG